MRIHKAAEAAGLTKKAIEYYTEKGLIYPAVLDNGYRDFNECDITRLKQIAVLRKCGLGVSEIKEALSDGTGESLRKISVRRRLDFKQEQLKKEVLDRLAGNWNFAEAEAALGAVVQNKSILEKLLEAFPGYYGRFICLHFSCFLDTPIQSEEQQRALEEVIAFLDNMPPFKLSEELEDYLIENTRQMDADAILQMLKNTRHSVENSDEFVAENREVLEVYIAYRQSEEYANSPAGKIQKAFKEFNRTEGYNDVFIPAMRRLSPSYAAYCRQLEEANKKMLQLYPEIEKLND